MPGEPLCQRVPVFCLIQREHRGFMPFFGQLLRCRVADMDGRRSGHYDAGALFERGKLIVQSVVLKVAHDLRIMIVIALTGSVEQQRQFLDPLFRGVCACRTLYSVIEIIHRLQHLSPKSKRHK